ncbi:MAG: hypothetical protein F4X60_04335 [Gemmatimonadetes bacterium]|nr:hypothetical protein [Gemmatimonadota bacterium]MYB97767.1 hypothetical protein [Gemmatimonadota bacterium]
MITRPLIAAARPGTRACQNGTGHRRDSCGPAAISRESDRHVFVVLADWADWAEGPYRITGRALALIEEGDPDARTRKCIVEALRRLWDAGEDRPVLDGELVESCSRELESV